MPRRADDDETLMTPREAAEYLRVSLRTIRRHLAAGTIRGRRVGKLWRIRKADLDAAFPVKPTPRPRRPSRPKG